MAKVSITLVCKDCGESFRHEKICRNRSEANDYENWAESHITQCPTCYKKEMRAIQRENDAKALEGINLPVLEGTERQVKWAEDIRRGSIAKCIKHDPTEIFWGCVEKLTSAKWWIDHRYDVNTPTAFLTTMEKEGFINA